MKQKIIALIMIFFSLKVLAIKDKFYPVKCVQTFSELDKQSKIDNGVNVFSFKDENVFKGLTKGSIYSIVISKSSQAEYQEPNTIVDAQAYYYKNSLISYFDSSNKHFVVSKSTKVFEKEYKAKFVLPGHQVLFYYETDPNRSSHVYALEWFDKNFTLRDLSTNEQIWFDANTNGVSTIFGQANRLGQNRNVSVVPIGKGRIVIMVDGKFYFYINSSNEK